MKELDRIDRTVYYIDITVNAYNSATTVGKFIVDGINSMS